MKGLAARTRSIGVLVLLLFFAACMIPETPPVDVDALAVEHGVPKEDLAAYLDGYTRGYDNGQTVNVGVRAGIGLGDVPGIEGVGWRQGFDDAVNGRPAQDPEALAEALAARQRLRR